MMPCCQKYPLPKSLFGNSNQAVLNADCATKLIAFPSSLPNTHFGAISSSVQTRFHITADRPLYLPDSFSSPPPAVISSVISDRAPPFVV
jgi:hypothetical protein